MFTPKVHNVSKKGLLGRRMLKRFLYAQMAMRSAIMIALGKEAPLVRFTVENDPPSIYLLFAIKPEWVERLPREIGLPSGMKLAPIRVLADDDPAHLLVLNVYRVSGITNGMRAEWSAYIEDADGIPRYMVVDARSSGRSMDPVDVITKASRVEHVRTGNQVVTTVGPDGATFESTITMDPDAPIAIGHPEFATANDMIYWANGIADRTFYDGGMAAADQISIPGADVRVIDNSPWAKYLEPTPVRTLAFRDAIELVVSPWYNVDSLD